MSRRTNNHNPSTPQTPEASSGRGPLVAGVAFSVAAHLGVIWLFASGVGGSLAAAAFPPPPDTRVTAGMDRQNAMSVAWLGFESPKEHEAQQSQTEQAALSPQDRAAPEDPRDEQDEPEQPAQPTKSETEPQPETSQELPDEPAQQDAEAVIETEAERTDPRPEQAPLPDPGLTVELDAPVSPLPAEPPVPEAKQAVPLPGETGEAVESADLPEDRTEPETSPRPETEQSSSEQSAAQEAAQSSAGPSPERPDTGRSAENSQVDGAPSEAESPATSLQRPNRITPGQVLAREGLQISTRVPPYFSIPTELLNARLPVLVEVAFDARGEAAIVRVLRSSGHPAVDQEWVNALYRWKATGEALDELDPDDPKSLKRMKFNVYR